MISRKKNVKYITFHKSWATIPYKSSEFCWIEFSDGTAQDIRCDLIPKGREIVEYSSRQLFRARRNK